MMPVGVFDSPNLVSALLKHIIMDEYLHIFGRTGDSAIVIDSEQTIVYWNAAAEKLLGYPAREAIGKKCWQLLRGRTGDGSHQCSPECPVMAGARRGETISHFDLIVRTKQEEEVTIKISTLNISQGQEEPHPALVQLAHQVDTDILGQGKLKIHLLGTTAVTRPEGSRVEGPLWRRSKVRALLAYLVLQESRPVHRDTLVELLWPELGYDAALRNLNTTVYNLRKSLEPNLERIANSRYVIYEGGSYFINGDIDHWLDVTVFEDYIKRARFAVSNEDAIQAYEKAVSLYQGDYLADLQTTAVWSPAEHIRLEELYLTALEALGSLYEAVQDDMTAKELYLKALSVDCVRESTVQKLMKLALRHGDYATARKHCLRLTKCLNKKLGMSPSPAIQALCQQAQCD